MKWFARFVAVVIAAFTLVAFVFGLHSCGEKEALPYARAGSFCDTFAGLTGGRPTAPTIDPNKTRDPNATPFRVVIPTRAVVPTR